MYWDIEITSEDEEEMIGKIALKIHEYRLDVAAILMIESVKPLSYVGAQMGRIFISPFLPILGKNVGIIGEKFLQIFEKRDNVEKLIKAVAALSREEEQRKKTEKAKKLKEKKEKVGKNVESERKGLRRILPF